MRLYDQLRAYRVASAVLAAVVMMAIAVPVHAEGDDTSAARLDQLDQRLEGITGQIEKLEAKLSAAVFRIETLAVKLTTQATAAEANAAPKMVRPTPRTWLVAVTQNSDPKLNHLFERLELQRDKLPKVTKDLGNARERYKKLRQVKPLDVDAIAQTRSEMIRLDYDQREIKALIRRIGLEIEQGRNHRVVTGLTSDGSVVRMQAATGMSDLAGTLNEGSTYRVTGTGVEGQGAIHVTMTSAEPSNLHLPVADAAGE